MTPTGIKTNGLLKRCTSHMNLTRTMADVDPDMTYRAEMTAYEENMEAWTRTARGKIKFAGYDGKERGI